MTTYGIIGSGTAAPKAIWAALDDLDQNATFIVPYVRTAGLELVFDWLVSNEMDFIVVGNPGKSIRGYAKDVIPSDGTGYMSVLSQLDSDSTLLVMWEDGLDREILAAANAGMEILELTNGLLPISVLDDDENPAPQVEVEAQVEVETLDEEEMVVFSEEDLQGMPVAAVKRYAQNMNMDIKGKTKDDIISELFPSKKYENSEIPTDLVLKDEYQPPKAPPKSKALYAVPLPVEAQDHAAFPVSVVVIMSDGTTITINSDASKLKRLVDVL